MLSLGIYLFWTCHTQCMTFLCLASSTWHNVFGVHPRCSMDQNFTPSYGQKISHCMPILRCVYPFIPWRASPKGFLDCTFLLRIGPHEEDLHGQFSPSAIGRARTSTSWQMTCGKRARWGKPPISLSTSTSSATALTSSCHSPSHTLITKGSGEFQSSLDSSRALLLGNKYHIKCRWDTGGAGVSTC